MKLNYILVLLSIFTAVACGDGKQEQSTSINASIKGHVSGFDKALGLYGPNVQKSIDLDNKGNFNITLDSILEGNYGLALGTESNIKLYLKEGSKLVLDIDLDKIEGRDKKAVSISGENIDETQLLYELMVNAPWYKYDRADYKDVYLPEVDKKDPKDFEAYQLKLIEKEKAIVKKYIDNSSIRESFLEVYNVEQLLKYNFTFQLYDRRGKAKGLNVPAKFKHYFKDQLPQNDFNLYHKSSRYAMYVRDDYYAKMRLVLSKYERESMDYFKAKVAYLDTCTFPKLIRNDMRNGLTVGYMRSDDKEIKAYLEGVIYQIITDEGTLKRFEDFKAGQNAYADGKPAPQFTLIDINGKEVSLSDFKGKMVMMDCWATWCAPCIKGLPKFNKLKEKYADKNIEFLAISVDENVELWKKKVNANKGGIFTGIQLNTSVNKNTFKKDLMVQGIPRYILIGKDGLIIRREAPQPASEEIIKLIDENL